MRSEKELNWFFLSADFLYIIFWISNMMRVTQNNSEIYDEGPPIIYGITEPVNEVREPPVTFCFFFCATTVCFLSPKELRTLKIFAIKFIILIPCILPQTSWIDSWFSRQDVRDRLFWLREMNFTGPIFAWILGKWRCQEWCFQKMMCSTMIVETKFTVYELNY